MTLRGPFGLVLLAAVACHDGSADDTRPVPTQSVPVQGAPPEALPHDGGDDAPPPHPGPPRGTLAAYEDAKVLSGKSIGHTSVVFKLKLEDDMVAAWKPSSKRGPSRYKGEVAAYRFARALGLPNVPPSVPRSFARDDILKALGGDATEAGTLLAKEGIANADGIIPGALIPWITHLDFMALEAEPLLTAWHGWLGKDAEVPREQEAFAQQISTLIVFDYMTGNWDRWSGGNIGFEARSRRLLFIDNDGAFYDTPPEGPLTAQRGRLLAVTRFSRHFVDRLRTFSLLTLRGAVGEETPGVPLLHEKALQGVDARRQEALRIIDAKIKKLGEERVLAFE